jgi:acetyl-CoA acetyltransferase/uncharacterized OB-fold protein
VPPEPEAGLTARGPALRLLPELDALNTFFWRAGAHGHLEMLACQEPQCAKIVHPPTPRCPWCHSAKLAPRRLSGRANLVSYTVNHHPWIPGSDPYVIALVAIEEQPDVRLTTNLVDCPLEHIEIGMELEVTFELAGDPEDPEAVWLPLFRPASQPKATVRDTVEVGEPTTKPLSTSIAGLLRGDPPERRAVISGIGQSKVGRRLGRGELDLTLEACLAAIEDAGLTASDIDGLSTYPGAGIGPPGFAGPGTPEVQDALRLQLSWHDGGSEGPGQLRAITSAVMAVASGLARHVLVYRTVTESSAQGPGGKRGIGVPAGGAMSDAGPGSIPRFSGFLQWLLPFGAMSAANWTALVAQRRFFEFGLTREQLAQVALTERAHAALNPNAVYKEPLDLEEYLHARMISTPFCLYDCDAPCDGSTAFVVSHARYAKDAPRSCVSFEALGTALRGRPSWDQFDDPTTMAARDAGMSLWNRTELRPSDVEVAQLYDGFSVLVLVWLEAMGFCGRGESGEFVSEPERISLRGSLPLNTGGGQLSGGRLHGLGLLHEACLQLRGGAGERQVKPPAGPEVAVVTNGGGPLAGCVLLRKS